MIATLRQEVTVGVLTMVLVPALLISGLLFFAAGAPSEPCRAGRPCGFDPLWGFATAFVVGLPSAVALLYAWLFKRPSPAHRIGVLAFAVLICVAWALVSWLAFPVMATPQP
jgi:hypothetical protein